jgi:hypothetical protein
MLVVGIEGEDHLVYIGGMKEVFEKRFSVVNSLKIDEVYEL